MKKLFLMFLTLVMCVSLWGCGGSQEENAKTQEPETTQVEIPQEVKDLQRKIDKALETEPAYDSLKEIKSLYDELLNAEQAMIVNYDKIEEMFVLDELEIMTIYAVNDLKSGLKNPNTLELFSAEITKDLFLDFYVVYIEYSAENSLGGKVENSYYSVVESAQDEKTGEWLCKLEAVFDSQSVLNPTEAQKYAKKEYEGNKEYFAMDVDKIKDNLDYPIGVLKK